MKYVKLIHTTSMNPVETFEGEFIEEKIARVVENKEPIEDGAPIIYTEIENTEGVYNDKKYIGIVQNYEPDHLAN